MRLKIKGGDERHRYHCRQFIRFFNKRFFTKEVVKDLNIQIDIKRCKKLLYTQDAASVEWVDNPRSPKKFALMINLEKGMSLERFITCVAHEMVHVKQYIKNELIDLASTDFELSVYKNKRYRTSMPYYEQPWEIEAYGRERGLMVGYFESIGMAKKIIR